MKIQNARFITSAADRGGWPRAALPEVAFAGRSNVGKSSLINSLTNRKNLAKTSATPGKTQLVNFFAVDDRFNLVDLPGYGYAKVPLAERARWRPMIETYLEHRETLQGVVVLIDSRRGAREMDMHLLEWLAAVNLPACLALTKADKLKQNERKGVLDALVKTMVDGGGLYGHWSGPILCSANTGLGKREILAQMAEWLSEPPRDAPAA
ncbi:MAG: ribosome biogenesis GTP-binding protein YihA/YsxC [Nitrospinae bacterium]|nr:ribosome biogenesis GTP-binding protein YihA/YsxC [Nitrospinota bacterium]